MRLRRLDLKPYGAFADRSLDFGDGGIDFHIVVGPNEAGKSTTLAAIGHLLFGFPGPRAAFGYNFRFDNGDLRIGAVIEGAPGTIEVMRRKGIQNTLLRPDGRPLPADALDPYLGGLGRDVFERMFGLDHEKLRSGGAMILEGRDDAARVMLEAGSGLTGLSEVLTGLGEEADRIWRPQAQNPELNALLREREAALDAARNATVNERRWKEIVERREAAVAAQAAAQQEARVIARRTVVLERVRRCRPLAATLAAAESDRAEAGSPPLLPERVIERMAAADAGLSDAAARTAALTTELERARADAEALQPDEKLIAAGAVIERIASRREIVAALRTELIEKRATLADERAAVVDLEAQAGIAASAGVPLAQQRRALRETAARFAAATADARRLQDEVAGIEAELGAAAAVVPEAGDAAATLLLKAAVEAARATAPAGLHELTRAAGEAAERARLAVAALAPWNGEAAKLRALPFPDTELSAAFSARAATLEAEDTDVRRDSASAASAAGSAGAEIARLEAGAALPSDEAVAAARERRDALIARIGSNAGRPEVSAVLASAHSVDELLDRRLVELDRVLEHRRRIADLAAAEALALAAEARSEALARAREVLERDWRRVCAAAGFVEPLLIAEMPAWMRRREAALAALTAAEAAAARLDAAKAVVDAAQAGLRRALERAAPKHAGGDESGLLALGEAELEARGEAAAAARQAGEALTSIRTRLAAAVARSEGSARELAAAEAAWASVRADVAIAGLEPEAVADLVETLAGLEAHRNAAAVLDARLAAVGEELEAYEGECRELQASLGRPGGADLEPLVAELAQARAEAIRRAQTNERIKGLEASLAGLEETAGAANADIGAMCAAAGCTNRTELAELIERAERVARAEAAAAEARAALLASGDGRTLEDLHAELSAHADDDPADELETLVAARVALDDQLAMIGGELLSACQAEAAAASDHDAADSAQRAREATDAAGQRAERYVELTAAATVLKWAIDRHRQEDHAPMLKRAGDLFREVTAGAFDALDLDFDDLDRARIVAVRPSGEKVAPAGMSEGTRDQLYLALRIASIAARSSEKPPLVCDDLLITADNERAAAMLKVLGAASAWCQVILFTHHEHLIPLAEAVIGAEGFRLHQLERALVAA